MKRRRAALTMTLLVGLLALPLVLAGARSGVDAAPPAQVGGLTPAAITGSLQESEADSAVFPPHRELEAALKEKAAKDRLQHPTPRTPGQDDFDVHHYELDITLNPGTKILTGTVAAQVEVTGASLSVLNLDLYRNMTVSAASSNGHPATWSHANDILGVNLDRVYAQGETVVVSVSYSGNPEGDYFGWDEHAGLPLIWTLSMPYGARRWWPCKDDLRDKADSLDLRVTVPDNLIVGSNGLLISDVDNGFTRTFHWQSHYPIATCLVSATAYPYYVYSDWYTPLAGGDPMEVRFQVFPDQYDQLQANYALTVPMIEAFAGAFGEYPFVDEKYGHAQFDWGGGVEHQTMTSLGGWWEEGIAHELAHQWWGDYITPRDYSHIWLAEGFATWCEAFWQELSHGPEAYRYAMELVTFYGPGTIIVEDPLNETIFDQNLSYNKASWVLHMLRHILGDEDFFAGLALYQQTYGFSTAVTEDFRDAMEAVSGKDLDVFFDQWIYGQYFPVYRSSWSDGPGGGTVELTIQQLQTNTGPFAMPIDVRVRTTSGTFDFVVQNSLALENYSLPVSGDVLSVELDPDNWILNLFDPVIEHPSFHRGVLLVNGVRFEDHAYMLGIAFEDSIFTGHQPFSFWDVFQEPAGGYQDELPPPIGHGAVPPDILAQFSTLIWVGNYIWGDLARWTETPIMSYLEAGGNVLLMTRGGKSYLTGEPTDYLGIHWAETTVIPGNYLAVAPGLVNIPFIGNQTGTDVFWPAVDPPGTLLFKATVGFGGQERGLGVHAQAPGGGVYRPDGARLVYLAGRPYDMNHAALRQNVEYILTQYFGEPYTPTALPSDPLTAAARLGQNFPNPFNPQTTLPFFLPAASRVELCLYDVAGRRVKTLFAGERPAGEQSLTWDGRDGQGQPCASGVYLARLRTAATMLERRLILLR